MPSLTELYQLAHGLLVDRLYSHRTACRRRPKAAGFSVVQHSLFHKAGVGRGLSKAMRSYNCVPPAMFYCCPKENVDVNTVFPFFRSAASH